MHKAVHLTEERREKIQIALDAVLQTDAYDRKNERDQRKYSGDYRALACTVKEIKTLIDGTKRWKPLLSYCTMRRFRELTRKGYSRYLQVLG